MINYCQEKISPEIHRKFIIETDLKYNILNRNYGGIMDDELKKLCEICSFSSSSFENLLDEYFFADKIFLYKLEVLLSSEANLNKLKKEKFFKEEIKNKLELKSYDIKCEQRLSKMNYAIENHIRNIQNFDFFN